jgi:hypothetical protein
MTKPRILEKKEELERRIGIVLAKKHDLSVTFRKTDKNFFATISNKQDDDFKVIQDRYTKQCACSFYDYVITCKNDEEEDDCLLIDPDHGFFYLNNFHADCAIRNYIVNHLMPKAKEESKND